MEFKVYKHVPPYLLVDKAIYFVSCRTYQGLPIIDSAQKKEIVLTNLLDIIKTFGYELHGWVILDNHYHVLFKVSEAKTIPLAFQRIHGKSSREINTIDGIRGRKVWYNYWDECVRDEKDYYNKLNYIHVNAVKHGYVKNPEDYEFSSYRAYLKAIGQDWIRDILARYPVGDLLKNDP